MKNITIVILAAGRSTRFISSKSKLTHDLAGLPIISHVYNTAQKISGKSVVVVCNKNNYAELNSLLRGCKLVIQKSQKGTADAIEVARPHIKTENFIILFGDVPLVTDTSLKKLIRNFNKYNIGSMILFKSSNPYGYGRVVLKKDKVVKVVEEIHTTKSEPPEIKTLSRDGIHGRDGHSRLTRKPVYQLTSKPANSHPVNQTPQVN